MDKKYFLIYQITNLLDNRIYIGAHCTNNENDAYMGSSNRLKKDIKKYGRENFLKQILFSFSNKNDMLEKEKELVDKEFCYRSDTYNQRIGGVDGFKTLGMVCIRDKNGETYSVYTTDPRYISGELKPLMYGKVNVKDNTGNTFQVDKDDPRFVSGELEWCTKGKIGNRGHLGKKHSEETKKILSERANNRTVHGMQGKKHSEETKQKISNKRKLKFLRETSK